MLVAWLYFIFKGRESLKYNFDFLLSHIILQLFSSLALILSGLAMIRGLLRAPALLMTAYAIVIFTQIFSVLVYGSTGHPFLMNGIAIILFIALIYFVGLVYAWEHFVFKLDQRNPPREKITK